MMPEPAGTPDEDPDKDHMFAGTARCSLVRYQAGAPILPRAMAA
jgi:hypothetical protein